MGPLIDKQNVARVDNVVKDALVESATTRRRLGVWNLNGSLHSVVLRNFHLMLPIQFGISMEMSRLLGRHPRIG